MRNKIVLPIAVSLIIFNFIPILNLVIPESITYTFLSDLCDEVYEMEHGKIRKIEKTNYRLSG